MKRILLWTVLLCLCCTMGSAAAWGSPDQVSWEALPPETLSMLEDRVLIMALQEDQYLYVLTEDSGGLRYLYAFAKNSDGIYRIQSASPGLAAINGIKPSITVSAETVCLVYGEGPSYAFSPDYRGDYQLVSVHGQDGYRLLPCLLVETSAWPGRYAAGVILFHYLHSFDPTFFPPSFADAAALLINGQFALVNNPDPADRLHLRTEPSTSAYSLGKYYNGAPVLIEEDLGDWVKAWVGNNEGYMMKRFLALDEDVLQVQPAFPSLPIRESLAGQDVPVYQRPDTDSELEGVVHDRGAGREEIVVIGVLGDQWMHVLCGNGLIGYMPSSMFALGN